MHVIALIDDAAVIRRILEHLGRWAPREMRRNQRAPPGDAKGIDGLKPPVLELTYHSVPDNPLPLRPSGGAQRSEIKHKTNVRGSRQVQAPDCGVPAGPSEFAAELIRLSLGVQFHRKFVRTICHDCHHRQTP